MTEEEFYKQSTIPDLPNTEQKKNKSHKVENVPQKIGPYPIEALLDRGGMSVLYLGVNPDTKSPVTIKALSSALLPRPEMTDRFFKEAEIIALADHPNIVKLFGHGEWEGGLYIAMEFIKGTPLKEYILRHPMKEKRALELILEIASAICHLHSNGIIHRDLKPENIIVSSENKIKVIDFGIAQMLCKKNDDRITQENRIMGTPIYMSPEQQKNPMEASYSSDIYSLGIIAYELLSGKLSHGVIQLEAIPVAIRPILEMSLKENPEERYQDIVDMMMDLSEYLKTGSLKRTAEKVENEKKAQKKEEEENPLKELKEHLISSQKTTLPLSPPSWPNIDIGLTNHIGSSISGVYYDFFELREGSYGVIIGESTARGISGVIYVSVLRGMIRALSWSASKPVELVAYLNELLINDPFDQIFTLNYLILYPNKNQLHFISCGYGNLWYIPSGSENVQKITADNIALGIDPEAEFLEISHNWEIGDTIVLNTFRATSSEDKKSFTENDFQKVLKKNAFSPAQKQTDEIFAKFSSHMKEELEERPITLISINRKG